MSSTHSSTAREFSLGVDGLPPAVNLMIEGRIYGLRCRDSGAVRQLAAGTLAAALQAGRPATVIVSSDPSPLLQALAACRVDANAAIAAEKLLVLVQTGSYAEKLARFGAEHFVQELDYYGLAQGGLTLVLDADGLFSLDNLQLATSQAEIYSRWFDSTRSSALLLFSRAAKEHHSATRRAVEDQFAGIAELARDGTRLNLRVERWRSPMGSLGGREYGLRADSAVLSADGAQVASSGQQLLLAPDQNRIVAIADALPENVQAPAGWEFAADLEALLLAARGAVAATLLLDHGQQSDLRTLARAVFELRRDHGRSLKIVVRETSARMRYSHEMLLLHLGANAVIDSGLSLSRCLALLESLRTQTFIGAVAEDFDAALAGAMPPPQTGYLRPEEFCSAVEDAIKQAGTIGVRCALVRLLLLPELAHLEVLRQHTVTRPGDMFSTDDRSVYVFLYACREMDVDRALENHFHVPLGGLFESQVCTLQPDAIATMVAELRQRLENLAVADFSAMFKSELAVPVRYEPAARREPAAVRQPTPPSPPSRAAPAARSVVRLGRIEDGSGR